MLVVRKLRGWHLCVVALWIWLLLPALAPAHFEGISAMTEIAARLRPGIYFHGGLASPLTNEFVYTSRPLMITLVRLAGTITGDVASGFQMLILISFVGFIAASCVVARALSGLPWMVLLLAVAGLNGVVSLGYSLNDNIVAGLFAMTALAIALRMDGVLASALAGGLMGLAFYTRPDALLMVPAIGLALWQGPKSWRQMLLRGGACATGFGLALVCVPLVTGVGLIDTLTYARVFTKEYTAASHYVAALDSREVIGQSGVMNAPSVAAKIFAASSRFLIFFGPGGLLLTALGLWQRRFDIAKGLRATPNWAEIRRVGLVYIYPAIMLAYDFRYAFCLRYFYLYCTPFLAVYIGSSIIWLGRVARRGALARAGAIAVAMITLALPPLINVNWDGPTTLSGTLWIPDNWLRFERGMTDGLAQVTIAGRDTMVVAPTTNWNEATFAVVAALRAGYVPLGVSTCDDTAAHLKGPNGENLVIISSTNPWDLTLLSSRQSTAMQIVAAARCHPVAPAHLVLADFPRGAIGAPVELGIQPDGALPSRVMFADPFHHDAMAVLDVYDLSPSDWPRMATAANAALRGDSEEALMRQFHNNLRSRLVRPMAARYPR